jgi:hypothetical protein
VICDVIGIDPGRTGALCLLYSSGGVVIHDMPKLEDGAVDGDVLLALFNGEAPGLIIHERLHGPDRFKIGDAYGALRVAALASRCRTETVPVQTWQKAMLNPTELEQLDTKRASKLAATRLLGSPDLLRRGTRRVDDNRADAVCIAFYGQRTYLTHT